MKYFTIIKKEKKLEKKNNKNEFFRESDNIERNINYHNLKSNLYIIDYLFDKLDDKYFKNKNIDQEHDIIEFIEIYQISFN